MVDLVLTILLQWITALLMLGIVIGLFSLTFIVIAWITENEMTEATFELIFMFAFIGMFSLLVIIFLPSKSYLSDLNAGIQHHLAVKYHFDKKETNLTKE